MDGAFAIPLVRTTSVAVSVFNSYLFSFPIPIYGTREKIAVNKGDQSKLQLFYIFVHLSGIRLKVKHHVQQTWICKGLNNTTSRLGFTKVKGDGFSNFEHSSARFYFCYYSKDKKRFLSFKC